MQRILVALDGSSEAEQILEEVDRMGTRSTAIDLIHVLPSPKHEVPALGVNVEDVGRSYLDRVASRIKDRPVRTFIWCGSPEEELPKAARSLKADLIALTTHARRGLSHLLMGSVAEGVVQHSTVPVLLVRHGFHRPRKPLERILVPVDDSAGSRQVTGTVKKLVADTHAEVILLQVVVPILVSSDPVTGFMPIGVPQPLPDPRPSLEEFARQLLQEGISARAVVTVGGAANQILDQARAIDADLIAMATAGRKGLSRFMIGSVARDVVRHMDRPVILHRISPKAEATSQIPELHVQGAD
jgi:nucleotide-binding universal stress UspA family protein